MQDIIYHNKKSLLITTDDFLDNKLLSQKLFQLRKEKYYMIIIVTSFEWYSLPKVLTDYIKYNDGFDTINCIRCKI